MLIKIALFIAFVAHILCGYCDCLLSYSANGRLNLKDIRYPDKMAAMFENMPLRKPMISILLGTFSITAMAFGYLALSRWMQQFNEVLANIMFASSVVFAVSIVTHHVFCGSVEWFYIRLGRTTEAHDVVLEFQKKTISTMLVGYLALIVFLGCLFFAVVTGQTDFPQWCCVFNTLILMLLLSPTKLPAKGNIAGAAMFLGLLIVI